MVNVRAWLFTAASVLGSWALTAWLDGFEVGTSVKAVVWIVCSVVVLWLWLTDDSRQSIRRTLYAWRRRRPVMSFALASLLGAVVAPFLWWLVSLTPPQPQTSESEPAHAQETRERASERQAILNGLGALRDGWSIHVTSVQLANIVDPTPTELSTDSLWTGYTRQLWDSTQFIQKHMNEHGFTKADLSLMVSPSAPYWRKCPPDVCSKPGLANIWENGVARVQVIERMIERFSTP
jgi:hypothetical protein